MPNACLNHLTIICHENPSQLQELYDKNLNNNNCNLIHKSNQGIIINIWSSWEPDFEWLDLLIKNYPECWLKNIWEEEGGTSGIYINGKLNGKNVNKIVIDWNDICIEGKIQYFGKAWYN